MYIRDVVPFSYFSILLANFVNFLPLSGGRTGLMVMVLGRLQCVACKYMQNITQHEYNIALWPVVASRIVLSRWLLVNWKTYWKIRDNRLETMATNRLLLSPLGAVWEIENWKQFFVCLYIFFLLPLIPQHVYIKTVFFYVIPFCRKQAIDNVRCCCSRTYFFWSGADWSVYYSWEERTKMSWRAKYFLFCYKHLKMCCGQFFSNHFIDQRVQLRWIAEK